MIDFSGDGDGSRLPGFHPIDGNRIFLRILFRPIHFERQRQILDRVGTAIFQQDRKRRDRIDVRDLRLRQYSHDSDVLGFSARRNGRDTG